MVSQTRFMKNTMGRIIIRFSGIIGLLAIGAMIFVGYHLNWHITWWYFVASIVAYSATIISLNVAVEEAIGINLFRWVLGCHLAFLFLVGGLYLNFQDLQINLGLIAVCITAGFALPFMLFTKDGAVNLNGVLGLLALGAMVFVSYHLNWHITWWYFVASIVAYSVAIISLNIAETNSLKLFLGCHFAFLFLVGGLYLNIQDLYINLGVFASAIAAGFALPFMWPKIR
jgi:hypothetical protein